MEETEQGSNVSTLSSNSASDTLDRSFQLSGFSISAAEEST